jgi:hypothetical protein
VPISGSSTTATDIYLDTKFAASAQSGNKDYRFDWDSSLLDKKGSFLQDYVFNVGTTVPPELSGCTNGFVVEASNSYQRFVTAHSSTPVYPGPAVHYEIRVVHVFPRVRKRFKRQSRCVHVYHRVTRQYAYRRMDAAPGMFERSSE